MRTSAYASGEDAGLCGIPINAMAIVFAHRFGMSALLMHPGTAAHRAATTNDRYSIETDRENGCLRIVLTGFWTDAILARYLGELRSKTDAMVDVGGYRGALVDASDYALQSQSVADGHGEAMRIARSRYRVGAAMLTSRSRSKLQLRRLTDENGQRTFDVPEAGLDWLLS